VCHHGELLKQSTRGTEEWDKEFHPSLILSVIASSCGPGKKRKQDLLQRINWKEKIYEFIKPKKNVNLKFTAGLAPSVKKISFGSAGKPSRASIPAAIVSRNPLIP
jgi:hypothetical protein